METPPHPPHPSCRDDFEIAIICALRLEYDAVSKLFDGYWNNDGDLYGKVHGDQNTYTTGYIGKHNVVLVLLSDMGKASATSVATSFNLSYARVQFAILVGICGGVPNTSDGTEILLGDVVVSQQLIQYDFGRRYSDGFRPKHTLTEGYAPSCSIRRFLATIQTERYLEILPKKAMEHLRAIQERYPRKYCYLGASEDKLFQSDCRHKHRQSAGCLICNRCTQMSHPTCEVALNSTCESLKCDDRDLVYRRRLDQSNVHNPLSAVMPRLIVHFGILASGDSVMKSAFDRDEIAERHNVIGFEMEGAGVFVSLPCFIIKGVCDYSDSHKNKKWQNYAAITAACVMKSLLGWYPSADRRPRPILNEPTEDMAKLQQTNQDLLNRMRELILQLRFQQAQLPSQVPCKDLVAVNDALGETYSFSLNFIDSLEPFVTILRHKFKHVGLGKIERGEWMLQNHRTGQILNLRRNWKAVVKPGQILDMSMIFRKRNSLSILCPWCNAENECSSDEQHVECRKCFGKYQRIEEVNEIGLQSASSSSITQREKLQPEDEKKHSCPKPSQREPRDDGDDIHMYTRVQIVDVRFRVVQQALKNASARLLMLSVQQLEDMEHLVEYLASASGLSKEDCLSALQDRYDDLLALKTDAGNKSTHFNRQNSERRDRLATLDPKPRRAGSTDHRDKSYASSVAGNSDTSHLLATGLGDSNFFDETSDLATLTQNSIPQSATEQASSSRKRRITDTQSRGSRRYSSSTGRGLTNVEDIYVHPATMRQDIIAASRAQFDNEQSSDSDNEREVTDNQSHTDRLKKTQDSIDPNNNKGNAAEQVKYLEPGED